MRGIKYKDLTQEDKDYIVSVYNVVIIAKQG